MEGGRQDFFAGQALADCLIIVGCFEGAEIEFADVNSLLGVATATLPTSKVRKERAFIHKTKRIKVFIHPTKSRESYKIHALSIFV